MRDYCSQHFHERLLDAHSGWAIVDDNRLPRLT